MRMARLNVTRKATKHYTASRDLATSQPCDQREFTASFLPLTRLYNPCIVITYPAKNLRKDKNMNKFEYIIEEIDGDYAHLRRTDSEAVEIGADRELKLVARALLPPEIAEGTRLLYEWMQYSILES